MTGRITITREFGVDAGHRVTQHESKCRNVHGHRYRIAVTVSAPRLDDVGRVLDFGQFKATVGQWLEDHWDHGYLYLESDPIGEVLRSAGHKVYRLSVEPTAENLCEHLYEVLQTLLPAHLRVESVCIWETPNCAAEFVPR